MQILELASSSLRSMIRAIRSSGGTFSCRRPSMSISSGKTQAYWRRQSSSELQVLMHHVSAVRLGTKRHSTHAPWGHVSGSHAKTVQYPPGCARSHCRSPVTEQSEELPQESPMFCWHPMSATAPLSKIGISRISVGGAYERAPSIANRSRTRLAAPSQPPEATFLGADSRANGGRFRSS